MMCVSEREKGLRVGRRQRGDAKYADADSRAASRGNILVRSHCEKADS